MITDNFRKILTLLFSSKSTEIADPTVNNNVSSLPTMVTIYGEEKQMEFANADLLKSILNGIVNMMNHMSTNSPDNQTLYLKVGEGTIPPTVNDFQLNYIYTDVSCNSAVVGNSVNYTKTYTATFSNPRNTDITITEVGLYAHTISRCIESGYISSAEYDDFLLDRTVLSTPITIPAGESKAITYELGF